MVQKIDHVVAIAHPKHLLVTLRLLKNAAPQHKWESILVVYESTFQETQLVLQGVICCNYFLAGCSDYLGCPVPGKLLVITRIPKYVLS